MNASKYIPSEENYARVLRGELPDPLSDVSRLDFDEIERTRQCPRDGRALSDRDNPRIPGLNRELFCSCGFAVTT